jgi:hypothetical protein
MAWLFVVEGLAALVAIAWISRYRRRAKALALVVIGTLGIGFSVTWMAVALTDRNPAAETRGDIQAAPEWNRFADR